MDSSVITAASNWLMQDPFPAHHNGGMVHGNGEMESNSRGDRPVALVAPVAHPGPRASAACPYDWHTVAEPSPQRRTVPSSEFN